MLLKFTPLPGQASTEVIDPSTKKVRFENIEQSITVSSFAYVDLLQVYPDKRKDRAGAVYVTALLESDVVTSHSDRALMGSPLGGVVARQEVKVPKRYFVRATQEEFEQAVAFATQKQTGIIDITREGLEKAGIRKPSPSTQPR